ncbi:MAG: ABC transporter ATP-binding protein [Pseudomonadota bacterium]|nr:ABC transporter ATP-binding protein [Pseudomonadota bacterium]
MTHSPGSPLLQVRDLRVAFATRHGALAAVAGVSFALAAGEVLAIVGESGSGKSAAALALTRLLPDACRTGGEVLYDGRNLLQADEKALQAVRGRHIAYIFQEPTAALNPVYTVGDQIAEAIALHFPNDKDRAGRVVEALRRVGIRRPQHCRRLYPHQLSGGMNQRVMIAMALACRPRILVADEPTTALDVTVQAQIMALLKDLNRQLGMAIILITHNFGIVKGLAGQVAVMRQGRVVEAGSAEAVLGRPAHPYTRALMDCVPRLGQRRRRLATIDSAADG